jgi:replication-associated recombination protein RarA
MRLDEKYRPANLGQVVGQDKAVGVVRSLMSRGIGGRAFWVAGESGTGKTTLARIMAGSVAHEDDTRESVARELTPAAIREITARWMYVPVGQAHAWIVNEAHGLSRPCIEVLLDILERLPDRCCVFFTTTVEGNDLFDEHIDAGPFSSRCITIKTTNQGLADVFARRAKEIAVAEGLDGQPIAAYKRLAQKCRNNLRAMLNEIEAGAML